MVVDLLGSVYAYGRLCHVNHRKHQPAAGLLSPRSDHVDFLDGIGGQLPTAHDNVQTYSTWTCLLPAALRISLAGPRYWVHARSSGRASSHGCHYAFGRVIGSNSGAHTTQISKGRDDANIPAAARP